MNLLPKSHEEFAQTDYWNTFFKQRGDKAFEWYGEYLELCDKIHKYVKKTDTILMLGCGNSTLSMDMYDTGFRNITNIDISHVAIKKMLEMNERRNTDMKFIQMDATSMTFEDESFNVALDKGTLDALFVDDNPDVRERVKCYFEEIARVMRSGGRYVCISLLQEHILKFILDFFPRNSFMVRVVYCSDVERANREKNADNPHHLTMPVFAIIATKFKALPTAILEFSLGNDKMQRVHTTKELINAVSSVQKAALVCNGLARGNIVGHNEVTMELCKPGEEKSRYTVHILDQPPARDIGKYAAFIVPQGREIEWLFATPEGRKKLQQSANQQRLAIVTLHRDQTYGSLDEVKAELADMIITLSPAGTSEQIPFLSLGTDIGKRETLVSGVSKISGEFRIEEVETDDDRVFRRLIFLSNQFVIQSEALIKTIKLKGKKERKKIDVGYLACQHHLFMSVGVQMAVSMSKKQKIDASKDILIIGLGGGGLCSFLHEAMPQARITAVEIDPIMLEIAEQYFEFKQDDRLHVVIDDGLAFLQRCRKEGITFDAVLFDVDSKDLTLGMSCPPKNFLEPPILENIKAIIGDNGIFILNLVCRNDVLRTDAVNSLQKAFNAVCSYKLDEDINEVIYCSNDVKYKQLDDWKETLGAACHHLNGAMKEHKFSNTDLLDVTTFLKDLQI